MSLGEAPAPSHWTGAPVVSASNVCGAAIGVVLSVLGTQLILSHISVRASAAVLDISRTFVS